MKRFFLFVVLSYCTVVAAAPFQFTSLEPLYSDEEFEATWASLADPLRPDLDDYLKIQHYLSHGRRPYLDIVIDSCLKRGFMTSQQVSDRLDNVWRRFQCMIFTGPNGELPRVQRFVLGGASPDDLTRCVVLFASYNYDSHFYNVCYADRVNAIVNDLEREGYRGHVLTRIGGYPLEGSGGLGLVHVPYSFKLLSFIEASLLGYEKVLWLDVAMHPVNDLSNVFSILEDTGTLLLHNGTTLDYDYRTMHHVPGAAIHSAGLTVNELNQIPHTCAAIIGIDFRHPQAHELVAEWLRLTRMVIPGMSLTPEEFPLSVAAWRTGCIYAGHIVLFIEGRSAVPEKSTQSAKPFWFDKS